MVNKKLGFLSLAVIIAFSSQPAEANWKKVFLGTTCDHALLYVGVTSLSLHAWRWYQELNKLLHTYQSINEYTVNIDALKEHMAQEGIHDVDLAELHVALDRMAIARLEEHVNKFDALSEMDRAESSALVDVCCLGWALCRLYNSSQLSL